MIRSLLIDMGNVLLFFSHDKMCQQLGELAGLAPREIQSLLLDSGLQWDLERGTLSPDEYRSVIERASGKRIDPADLRRAASDIFQINESMIRVLDHLSAQNYRLVLLSNVGPLHFDWVWENYEILQRLDHLVLSFEARAIKPEPRIFDVALAAIDCPPQECLYTDDIPKYVEAGRTLGLHTHLFTTTENYLTALRQYDIDI